MVTRARSTLNMLMRLALALSAAPFATSCESSAENAQGAACTPVCREGCGQPDGCGGTCACPVDDEPACTETCESLGKQCGEVCGESCGSCAPNEQCEAGACQCRPVCDGTRCDDGCGGVCDCADGTLCDAHGACLAPEQCNDTCQGAGKTCGDVCGQACGTCGDGEACLLGSCQPAAGCTDCALHLTVLDKKLNAGHIVEVRVAVEYAPAEGSERPRMADVRLRASAELELVAAEAGPALTAADKSLYVDDTTQKAWKKRADGSYQLLAYGFANTRTFEPGRLIVLTFRGDALGPATFALVRRDQTFAPSVPDQALQSTPYDQAVVVSR
jgi:hypothetical protein